MENMFELLATQPRVRDAPRATALRVTHGAVEFKQVGWVGRQRSCSCWLGLGDSSPLELRLHSSSQLRPRSFHPTQVVFSYNPASSPPVLRGLSFCAPGGRSLAVVGSTGSGKSTLLRWGAGGAPGPERVGVERAVPCCAACCAVCCAACCAVFALPTPLKHSPLNPLHTHTRTTHKKVAAPLLRPPVWLRDHRRPGHTTLQPGVLCFFLLVASSCCMQSPPNALLVCC
jgi:hypothetical protein